jgi:uncharacterized membrane protein YcaP (DUF421 family)
MLSGLFLIAFRAVIVYIFIILGIRIFGKRELAQLSVIDLVFILLISNAVQNAMVGPDNSLLGGLTAAVALFAVNLTLNKFAIGSKQFNRLLEGEAIMLIHNGKVLPAHLKKAQISHEELEAAIREHGVKDISAVDLAVLENDGNISILSDGYKHKTVQKRKAHRALQRH